MSSTAPRPWLREQFDVLLGAYTWPEKAGEFAAWDTWLGEFPEWAIKAVVFNAVDRWPEKMPTVGVVRRATIELLRKRRNMERDRQPPPEPSGPTASPMHPDFIDLASLFEDESRRLGLDPGEPSPQHIAVSRAHAVSDLFEKHSKIEALNGEGVDLQTNPQDKEARPPE